jgi:hypothetical protein
MREKSLTIVRGGIAYCHRIDGDALFGQPENARFVTPIHLGIGFHNRSRTLIGQFPVVGPTSSVSFLMTPA